MDARNPEDDDLALTRLLREARWHDANADADRLARLHRRWTELRRTRHRARWMYATAAIAAGLVIGTGAVTWLTARARDGAAVARPEPSPAVAPEIARPRSTEPKTRPVAPEPMLAEDPAATRQEQAPAVVTAGRPPSLYERTLMAGRVRPKRQKAGSAARGLNDDKREQLILAMADDAEVPDSALPTGVTRRQEQSLATIVRQSAGERRIGAARLLSRVATARSLPVLARLSDDPETHEAAIAGLARLADAGHVAQLVDAEQDANLRRPLLATLLERGTEESVGLYLDFVRREETNGDALDAVGLVAAPPTDALIGFLRSSQSTTREAAAEAVARITEPDALERIAASTVGGVGRQEVLLALLMNPSPQAARLVQQARQDLYLLAAVQAAEHHLHELIDPPRR
ncbi:MAG: hypothetical protein HYX69_02865 [Planctomycetia bacterium]|nr:hypothetical protein [Planctomycetia bacterium]